MTATRCTCVHQFTRANTTGTALALTRLVADPWCPAHGERP